MSGRRATLVVATLLPLLNPRDFSAGGAVFPSPQWVSARPLLSAAVGQGQGHIADTVAKQEEGDLAALPVARRVVLLLEPTLQYVAETTSDAFTGAYRFDGLSMSARFTVVAYDHLHNWRAVIADNLAASA